MNTTSKIEKEKQMIETMITLYCRKHHKNKQLCDQCLSLIKYSHKHLDNCRYGQDKHFCGQCPTPCYGQEQRAQIKEVMGFSGPRMILYNPKAVLKHIILAKRKNY